MEKDRLWILLGRKLSGEASPTELTELEELAARFPETDPARLAIEATWNSKNPLDNEFLEATYLQHLGRLKARGYSMPPEQENLTDRIADNPPHAAKPTVFRQFLLAILVAALFISTWLIIDKPDSKEKKDEPNRVSTKNGSRTKLLLPDGSGVWLNAGSTLTYQKFDGKIREVQLTGEAFFDVINNPERPFIIRTSRMSVKVLGTQFNVKAYPEDNEYETSVIKGSVEVYPANRKGEKFVLKPKQKFVLANIKPVGTPAKNKNNSAGNESIEIKELTYLNGTSIDIESNWTRNMLSFQDESFTEVAKKMERWFDVKIDFKNKQWEQHYLSGSFQNETLEEAMSALRFSTGFNYTINDRTVLIY